MKHVKLAAFAEDRKKISVEGEFIKKWGQIFNTLNFECLDVQLL